MKRFWNLFLIVMILGLFGYQAYAQSDIGFKGVGGRLGFVDPEGVSSAIGIGIFADLGQIAPDFHLEVHIDYWSKSVFSGFFYTGFPPVQRRYETSIRDIALGGTVKYIYELEQSKFTLFALGGLSFHFLSFDVDYGGDPGDFFVAGYDTDDTKLGIDLGGGSLYDLSEKVDLIGELKYRIVSDISQLVLQIGALVHL